MIKLYNKDCLQQLKELADNSVDSIITDPPYELGFMGKSWDNTGIANNKEMWAECLRVLKHGGHLLAFGGTRTYHRMACAIEDAGFEVRDMITWAYGQGFPKSLNVFKQLQKKCECGNMGVYENRTKQVGANSEKESEYFMRFMQESDLSQTKSLGEKQGQVLQSGLSEQSSHSAVLREESKESSEGREERILEGWNNNEKTEGQLQGGGLPEMPTGVSTNGEEGRIHNATQISDGSTPEQTTDENGSSASHRPQSEQQQYKQPCAFCKQWGTQATRTLGIGSALKPSVEPICFARKPLAEKTVAENVLKWGTGGINIDESRVESELPEGRTRHGGGIVGNGTSYEMPDSKEEMPSGRFPANLITDGSEEVRECFPETKSGGGNKATKTAETFLGTGFGGTNNSIWKCDSGNASRFFKSIIYQAKASKSDRNEGCEGLEEKEGLRTNAPRENEDIKTPTRTNNHPTVKPTALMQYLIKMITPKGGIVLDPFMGSGSTGKACIKDGFSFIGIEKEEEYFKIAEARILTKDKQLKF